MKKIILSLAGVMFFVSACGALELDKLKLQNLIPEKYQEKIKLSGEFRYRLEYRDNFDFDSSKDDEDVFHLFRTRLNLDVIPWSYLHGFVQLQDAHIASSDFSNDTPFEDAVDLRQGFAEYYDAAAKGIGIRLGRQELSYGAERLIGAFNWSNVAQSFDAVKVYYQWEAARLDAFVARKVIIDSSHFNDWDDDDNLAGLYGSCQVIKDHTLELYYFFRDTDKNIAFGPNVGSGDLSESTIGARIVGKQGFGLDYQLESAFQFGDFADQDISAWMMVAIAGYTFDIPWTPRIAFEFDHASGDEAKDDGERNTFDNLFPTNHLFYGFMDLVSLQNINDFVLSAGIKPTPKFSVKIDGHFFLLDETSDSLYNAARVPVRTAESGSVSDEVGAELDLTLNYQICSFSSALIGYSHFFSGDFLSDSGAADDGDFFYTQLVVSF